MNLEVGDRVNIYGGIVCQATAELKAHAFGLIYKVVGIVSEDSIYVADDVGCFYYAHPKQCRKLIKKKYRSVWVMFANNGQIAQLSTTPRSYNDGWVEFMEKRANKCSAQDVPVRAK